MVLQHFSAAVLRRSVVWQPAGGGFMMRSSRRYKGECAAIEPEMVARLETQYLDTLGVQCRSRVETHWLGFGLGRG